MAFGKRYGGNLLSMTLLAFDAACALAACAAAAWLTLPPDVAWPQQFWAHFPYFAVFLAVWSVAATEYRLLSSRREDPLFDQLLDVAKAVVLSLVFSGFVVGFFTQRGLERDFLLAYGLSAFLFILLFRLTLRLTLWAIRRHGYNYRHVLIVGANPRTRRLMEGLARQEHYGLKLLGVVEDDPARMTHLEGMNVDCLGGFDELEKLLTGRVVDEVFITLPIRTFYTTITSMAHLCEGVGVPVRFVADLFPLRVARSRVFEVLDIPVLSLSAVPESEGALFIKRILDLLVSSLLLLLVGAWLFPIVAVLIKLESRGPVFFRQERVGLNQRRFRIFKFRSMGLDAEARRKELEALNEADGPVFKIRQDPRVTRVGRYLRKLSIDELPQLFNVWLGQMSLVGPRPPIPAEVEKYTWDQRRRLSVKPGMTGLWQISGRSDVSFEDWVEMDLRYIDTWSLVNDFRILWKTFRVVVLGKGAA